MRVLILGGSSEASALAQALAGRADVAATLSLAGRTQNPAPSPLPTRVGGFGGIDGLRRYLVRENVAAVVDATHPFAAQMSRHAFAACRAQGVRLLAFSRPPWPRLPGDDWIDVADTDAAVAALGAAPRRVFLTQGRLRLGAFAAAPQHRYVLRAIDRPAEIDALRDARLILSRGPFRVEDEMALMREAGIEFLVTKNSGAAATYPKIEGARRLGVRVVMIGRPELPEVETVFVLDAALRWIEAHLQARSLA